MAEKLRIFPILRSQLQFAVSAPVFEPLAAQILGVAATPLDGFDADLLAVADQLVSDTNLVAAGDADLKDADFAPGAFASANIDPLVHDTGAFTAAGSDLVQSLDDSSQVPNTPAPGTQACSRADGHNGFQFDVEVMVPGESSFSLGKVYQGDCTVVNVLHPFKDNFVHSLRVHLARIVFGDPAFKPPTFKTIDFNGPVHELVYVPVECKQAGTLKAQLEIVDQATRAVALLDLSIEVVPLTTAAVDAAANFLPLRG